MARTLASIQRVSEIIPIEGAERIQEAVVLGEHVVVSKGWKEGDVGLFFPVDCCIGLFLCHNLITSKQSVTDIPVPESPEPSSPDTFMEKTFAFFAQPKVLPATIPAT